LVIAAVTKDPREPMFNLSSPENVPVIIKFTCQHLSLTNSRRLQRGMQTNFGTVSPEVFLEGLGDTSREVVGASLELKIRATLVDHMVASCIRRQ